MMGIKQDALALDLGDSWNQKKISLLEQKEVIEPELLQQIADILRVPPEAIANFDEEKAVFNIQNNFEGSNNSGANNGINNYQCTFNPLDKWIESMDENKRLYEALLKSEREKIALLEKLLETKSK